MAHLEGFDPTRPATRAPRRLWFAGLLLVVAVALAACGQPTGPTPAPTKPAAAVTSASTPSTQPTTAPTTATTKPAAATTASPAATKPAAATPASAATKPAAAGTATPTPATAPTRAGTLGAGATASPTHAAATTPGAANCPVDLDACVAADRLNDLLTRRDIDGLVAATTPEQFTCPGPRPTGAGDAFPLCEGSAPGERRTGYSITYFQGERSVVSEQGYRTFLTTWLDTVAPNRRDSIGEGRLLLYTVGCGQGPASATPPCPDAVAIVFSALREGAGIPAENNRFALLFFVQPGQTQFINRPGSAMTQINDPALLTGGSVTDFPWPTNPGGAGRFFTLMGRP